MYYHKRKKEEWLQAITKIIEDNGGEADYYDFYNGIPKIIDLNPRELALSGVKKEAKWRGTLRGYLSDLWDKGYGILQKEKDGKQLIWSFKK